MFPKPMTVREVAAHIEATVEGDESLAVAALAAMDQAGPDDLSFAANVKRIKLLARCSARAVIVPADADLPAEITSSKTLLRVDNVERAVAMLLSFLAGPESATLPAVGVAPSAVIDPTAQLGPNVAIGPNVVIGPRSSIGQGTVLCSGAKIGPDVSIGASCVFHEGVVVRHNCEIGQAVRIGPNTVIGSDGFGYYFADGAHNKVTHIGNVIIEDGAEVGACTCVDRAKWGSTRIGAGAKIDNLVQIAHNVQVGPGCLLVSQVGIAGSTKLGRFVVLGGSVGIRDNIEIGDGTEIGACSCLAQSVGPGERLFGIPAKDAKTALREWTAAAKLPELLKRVKTLEKKIATLEASE